MVTQPGADCRRPGDCGAGRRSRRSSHRRARSRGDRVGAISPEKACAPRSRCSSACQLPVPRRTTGRTDPIRGFRSSSASRGPRRAAQRATVEASPDPLIATRTPRTPAPANAGRRDACSAHRFSPPTSRQPTPIERSSSTGPGLVKRPLHLPPGRTFSITQISRRALRARFYSSCHGAMSNL